MGIEARGADLKELFANAARGFFQVVTDAATVREKESREIEATAGDREGLLVAWLNEFVYRFDAEHMLFRRFEIHEMSDVAVKATAHGERVDPERHPIKTGVKSATYHGVSIEETPKGWRARVILDI